MTFKIKTISAYLAEDENGAEGIIGQFLGDSWLPFVMADETRIQSLRPFAQKIKESSNKKVKLVRFSVREDLESL